MLVQDIAKQPVSVREALGAGTLPHAHDTVLFRMKHTTLQARGMVGQGTRPAIVGRVENCAVEKSSLRPQPVNLSPSALRQVVRSASS